MMSQRKGRKRFSLDIPDEIDFKMRDIAKRSNITLTKATIRAFLLYIYQQESYMKKEG